MWADGARPCKEGFDWGVAVVLSAQQLGGVWAVGVALLRDPAHQTAIAVVGEAGLQGLEVEHGHLSVVCVRH